VISVFFSSYIRNLHWLLLTYSFPYGFANATIFILGTLICGLYYPADRHSKHIFVMCIISTGFPIGYHVMSAFIFSSIIENGWQSMKRRVASIELIAACILGPFFTSKFLPTSYHRPSITPTSNNNRRIYFSMPIVFWMLGIFTTTSAVNNFLLHLVCFKHQKQSNS
jgi:MFS family permease